MNTTKLTDEALSERVSKVTDRKHVLNTATLTITVRYTSVDGVENDKVVASEIIIDELQEYGWLQHIEVDHELITHVTGERSR